MTRTLALAVRSLLLCAALGSTFDAANAATIVSWDSANQRGGDLLLGLQDNGYMTFRNTLLSRGHVVLPGISTLTAASLTGVDVFFWGTSSHVLSAAEQTVLSAFISSGGKIILETDSIASEQAAADSAYAALGLGAIDPVDADGDGDNSTDQGTFANVVTATTVGLLADIRGGTWGGTNSPSVPGSGVVVGAVGTSNKWVEYAVGAGYVLGVADPFGFDIFTNNLGPFPGPYYNPNNLNAYLNFIETDLPIPEPGTSLLVGLGLIGLAARRRLAR